MVYMIDRAMEDGFVAAVLVFVGVLAVDAFVLAAGIFGFARILGGPLFTGITAVLGGLFLAWTGVSALRRPKRHSPGTEETEGGGATGRRPIHPIMGGAMVAVANPLYWVWWATVGLGFINWTMAIGKDALVAFICGIMGAVILFHVILAFLVAKGRSFISDKLYAVVVRVSGVVLGAFGILFLYLGAKNLLSLSGST